MKKIPNEFNSAWIQAAAIYIPFAQACAQGRDHRSRPLQHAQERQVRPVRQGMPAGAIDYKQKDEIVEREYGAIVVATGYNPIKLDDFDEYAYAQSKDVVTSLEFERLINAAGPTGGTLLRPSDGKHPHTIVFVQCVGSRCAMRARARATAPRSAACTRPSTRC